MAFLVVLVLVVAVTILVLRSSAQGGPGRGGARPVTRPRPTRSGPPLAPDDDPEFLRELERRTRRDDGSPA